jgi:hypothetical protein
VRACPHPDRPGGPGDVERGAQRRDAVLDTRAQRVARWVLVQQRDHPLQARLDGRDRPTLRRHHDPHSFRDDRQVRPCLRVRTVPPAQRLNQHQGLVHRGEVPPLPRPQHQCLRPGHVDHQGVRLLAADHRRVPVELGQRLLGRKAHSAAGHAVDQMHAP